MEKSYVQHRNDGYWIDGTRVNHSLVDRKFPHGPQHDNLLLLLNIEVEYFLL